MNPLWFFVILATVNGSEDTDVVCDTGAWPNAKWGDGKDGLGEVKFLKIDIMIYHLYFI